MDNRTNTVFCFCPGERLSVYLEALPLVIFMVGKYFDTATRVVLIVDSKTDLKKCKPVFIILEMALKQSATTSAIT